MTIRNSNHENYLPIGSAITHSYYFSEDDSGLKGFLKAKIDPAPGQTPRFSPTRAFNLADPNGQIDYAQLKEYCAQLNIDEIDAMDIESDGGPLGERFSNKVSEGLCLRDAFPPQRSNTVLWEMVSQLKSIPVSCEVSALKEKLVSALETIYETQQRTNQPVSTVYHSALLQEAELARKALFHSVSETEPEVEKLAEFDHRLISYFIETSWCQAIDKASDIHWWG